MTSTETGRDVAGPPTAWDRPIVEALDQLDETPGIAGRVSPGVFRYFEGGSRPARVVLDVHGVDDQGKSGEPVCFRASADGIATGDGKDLLADPSQVEDVARTLNVSTT